MGKSNVATKMNEMKFRVIELRKDVELENEDIGMMAEMIQKIQALAKTSGCNGWINAEVVPYAVIVDYKGDISEEGLENTTRNVWGIISEYFVEVKSVEVTQSKALYWEDLPQKKDMSEVTA